MLTKIINLIRLLLKGEVVADFSMIGLKRERLIHPPRFTNYIRINNLELVAHEILDRNVEGSIAELGVYKGEFAKYLNRLFPNRKLYLFDTFEGFDQKDVVLENNHKLSDGRQDFSNTSVDLVLSKMIKPESCIIKKGYFPESLEGLEDKFCFVSLDADLYQPILSGLDYFYPRLSKGGYIFIHDFNNEEYPGSKKAVREFCQRNNISYTPISDSWGTVVICK